MITPQALTLQQFSSRIAGIVAAEPSLRNVWVTGETSDLRVSGGHCYFELVEKDPSGRILAKVRANCWANTWQSLSRRFRDETGADLVSGLKVMVCLSATYHPAYGLSVTVSDINSAFTLGDAVRRRNEIIARLQQEGLLERQRNLQWTMPALRIAVISAAGAAGYGDFINQLYTNPRRLNFRTRLFPAMMQGERTVSSVMDALEAIAAQAPMWDGVVIIRGGGATTDLAWFDNYDLARAIAMFPLPVVVGIGHERDITVLDYVANMRVKTPTAAAEWFIARGQRMLEALQRAASAVMNAASAHLAGNREQLARIAATLPGVTAGTISTRARALDRLRLQMETAVTRRISPQKLLVASLEQSLKAASLAALRNQHTRILAIQNLLEALSPQTVLRRGFSITTGPDGHILTSSRNISPGMSVTTILADGSFNASVSSTSKNNNL